LSSIKCGECGFVTWAGAAQCKRCGAFLDSINQPPESSASQIGQRVDRLYTKRGVRRAGLKTVKSGAVFTAVYLVVVIAAIIVNSSNSGYHITFNLIGFAGLLPVAWLLAGVLQIITGVPFEELSGKWDNLAGWQRGLIGVSVFLAGLLVLAIVCVVIAVVLDWRSGRPLF